MKSVATGEGILNQHIMCRLRIIRSDLKSFSLFYLKFIYIALSEVTIFLRLWLPNAVGISRSLSLKFSDCFGYELYIYLIQPFFCSLRSNLIKLHQIPLKFLLNGKMNNYFIEFFSRLERL